ncbi:MAG: hypothetical protein R3356_04670 [Eudoraea sp.]|nr:hypothetical protein [Eudoraea sp.]
MIPENYKAFIQTLKEDAPNSFWPEALKALWYDGKGNWEASHNIAQDLPSLHGNWIHAYLHRKEGDQWNAGYWYQRANRAFPSVGLYKEYEELVKAVIDANKA